MFPSESVSTENQDELTKLGILALSSGDVPVASIILYKNKIIGSGFNTVYRDKNAAGHAEINAINDAINHSSFAAFSALNRDSLFLISTFEPCPMCKAAIQEYRIKYVRFFKAKSVSSWFMKYAGDLLYELNKRKTGNSALQDSLFSKHPDFTEN